MKQQRGSSGGGEHPKTERRVAPFAPVIHPRFFCSASSNNALPDAAIPTNAAGEQKIHDRGEGTEGYSNALQQLDIKSALRAEMADYSLHASPDNNFDAFGDYDKMRFDYVDALSFPSGSHDDDGACDSSLHDAAQGAIKMPPMLQIVLYESGMQ